MRQKLEREKQLALEKQLAKEEKEKEYERIIFRQQKLMESKTEKNELEYRRQREQVEREFRKREKEAAIKKREMGIAVSKARAVQLEEVVSIIKSIHLYFTDKVSFSSFFFFFISLLSFIRNVNVLFKFKEMRLISKHL